MKKLFLLLFAFLAFTASAYSSDVSIGASTIPGFQPANLPPDVTVSPVSVVNGSPVVTCSNCFRSQWVGLGGFRITINTVPYTVAYVSSRSALALTTNYAAGDSPTATILWYKYVELRIYADSSFQPLGKTYVVQPGAPGSGAWHRRVAASVVNELGINNLYIPQLTLDATTDSLTNQAARYTAAFYRPEGSLIQFYDCFESFLLAPTGATTWPDICMFNTRQVIVQDDSTYTKTQVDSMRTGCTVGQSLFYASTGLKPSCLTIGAGLQIIGNTLSATAGSSYQTILNNGTLLTQRTTLNFLAPSFIASDNVGGLRTDVTADADLNALASNATNGFWAAGTNIARTLTGTVNRITITNGNGTIGDPVFDIGSTVATSGSNLSFFAATTSAQLAGVISDESGSGALLFGTSPTIATPMVSGGTFTNSRIVTAILDTNGNALFNLTATASAVNQFTAANAATGNGPTLSATGSGTNIPLNLLAKGAEYVAASPFLKVTDAATPHTRFIRTAATARTVDWGIDNSDNFILGISAVGTPLSIAMATQVATFSAIPVLPASNPTTANQAARKQYVDDTSTAWSIDWFIVDLDGSVFGSEAYSAFVVPNGTSILATHVKCKRAGGTHTAATSVSFSVTVRTAASSWATKTGIGSCQFDNTNSTIHVVYTTDIADVALNPGDTVSIEQNGKSGTVAETNATFALIGTQKRIP